MSERQGIEIDYCPACRGIWLDRGELDKLLERATTGISPGFTEPTRSVKNHHKPDFKDSDYRDGQLYERKRQKSWLNELFD